jgi:hypothetical protein
MSRLEIVPLDLKEANDLVAEWHRHHQRVVGHKFSIGVQGEDGQLHGAAIVGRPVARMLDDKRTLEVTRCVTDGTPNACSALYGAAWRVARAMGYHRLITYVLASESGGSLKASGWKELYKTPGRSWSVPSRPREDKHPLGQKTLWAVDDGSPTVAPKCTKEGGIGPAQSAEAASS